ncbi:MAG: DUF2384 domain-containing protein [Thiomicrorhabdus sp.]|nr:DUF2384 domain-containing protein [Thiomicrorhabdus sp.]
MSIMRQTVPNQQDVLTKATINVAEQLGLSNTDLSSVLGVHRTVISKLKKNPTLSPTSKEGELALILIRIARALYALTGGDKIWMQHFMRTPNTMTGGVPAEQIKTIQGLMEVLRFVDAIRSKV